MEFILWNSYYGIHTKEFIPCILSIGIQWLDRLESRLMNPVGELFRKSPPPLRNSCRFPSLLPFSNCDSQTERFDAQTTAHHSSLWSIVSSKSAKFRYNFFECQISWVGWINRRWLKMYFINSSPLCWLMHNALTSAHTSARTMLATAHLMAGSRVDFGLTSLRRWTARPRSSAQAD